MPDSYKEKYRKLKIDYDEGKKVIRYIWYI